MKYKVIRKFKEGKNIKAEIEFYDYKDDDGNFPRIIRDYGQVKKGLIENPFKPTAFGIGYTGYLPKNLVPDRARIRESWYSMLDRTIHNDKHYESVSVHRDWLNFSNYYKWITSHEHYSTMVVDKDLKQMNTKDKVYGPDTCVMIPQIINIAIAKNKINKVGLPSGIEVTRNRKFEIRLTCSNKVETLRFGFGRFSSIKNAVKALQVAKEEKIKSYAKLFKNEITDEVYELLCNFEEPIHKRFNDVTMEDLLKDNQKFFDKINIMKNFIEDE